MNEYEKLAWLIAEEFVRAFEELEAVLEAAEPEEYETHVRVLAAKA